MDKGLKNHIIQKRGPKRRKRKADMESVMHKPVCGTLFTGTREPRRDPVSTR